MGDVSLFWGKSKHTDPQLIAAMQTTVNGALAKGPRCFLVASITICRMLFSRTPITKEITATRIRCRVMMKANTEKVIFSCPAWGRTEKASHLYTWPRNQFGHGPYNY